MREQRLVFVGNCFSTSIRGRISLFLPSEGSLFSYETKHLMPRKIKLKPFSRTAKEAAARLAIAVFVAGALGYAVLLPNLPKNGEMNESAAAAAAAVSTSLELPLLSTSFSLPPPRQESTSSSPTRSPRPASGPPSPASSSTRRCWRNARRPEPSASRGPSREGPPGFSRTVSGRRWGRAPGRSPPTGCCSLPPRRWLPGSDLPEGLC